MKTSISLRLFIFLLLSVSESDGRTWTTKSGSTVEAEIVDFKAGAVFLRRADGGKLRVDLDKLSIDDQAFVKKFLQRPIGTIDHAKHAGFQNSSKRGNKIAKFELVVRYKTNEKRGYAPHAQIICLYELAEGTAKRCEGDPVPIVGSSWDKIDTSTIPSMVKVRVGCAVTPRPGKILAFRAELIQGKIGQARSISKFLPLGWGEMEEVAGEGDVVLIGGKPDPEVFTDSVGAAGLLDAFSSQTDAVLERKGIPLDWWNNYKYGSSDF